MSDRYFSLFLLFLTAGLFGGCNNSNTIDENDEHEDHDHSGIVFEPEKARQFGIELEKVAPGSFHDVIKTSGSIESSSSDLFTVTAKKNGIITLEKGLNVGIEVKKGEKIGYISAEGVQGGDASKVASSNLETAKAEYERLKKLYEEKLVTASTFREAERSYKEAEAIAGKGSAGGSSVLVAPSDGFIGNLSVRSGDYVEVGSPVATISKNANMTLKADFPSREARHLSELESANFIPEGHTEVIKIADLDGKKISGNSNQITNGYIPVYFSFKGNPLSYPGGYAEIYLICGKRDGVISVPREALVEIQGNKYVYVALDEDEYEKRLVKTGASDGERIEITEGLNPGDNVVAKSASIIRMAEVSSIAPPAHTHNH